MKGRLFGVTMFVLVLVMALAVPASAAPRPPVQTLTVEHWTPSNDGGGPEWNFAAAGINWQGYKPARVYFGHTYCDQAQVAEGCLNPLHLVDAAIQIGTKGYAYPQNLNLADTTHIYKMVGEGCRLTQFVELIDSRGMIFARFQGPTIPACIELVRVQMP